eukprot:m.17602 g.17602  ORF g.17602 m.17602 type:complete len:353 (+) comp27521_c0_seq2:244-1302(+)
MPEKGDQMDVNDDSDELTLRPFPHQVGGHYAMMQIDEKSVCKPLNATELLFYKTAPDAIRKFLPQFEGTIDLSHGKRVSAVETTQGEATEKEEGVSSPIRASDTTNSPPGTPETESKYKNGRRHRDHDLEASKRQWTRSDFIKPRRARRNNETMNYLVLENIVGRFHCPSIMDIKMGTQQHGDDATLEKMDRQKAKCAFTTSSRLGLRICGMKVFLHSCDTYMHRDKYFGRRLTLDTFKSGLLEYLDPVIEIGMSGVINAFIKRLSQLKSLIEKQETYRFYSSSLLLVYDSKAESPVCFDDCMDVRMIDFAHSTSAGDGSGLVHKGPDRGYLLGLQNLIKFLKEVASDCGCL